MDWYFTQLTRTGNSTTPVGSIYDYYIDPVQDVETATNDFDSTDSYASTFLNVVRKYAEVTGDEAYVLAHEQDIRLIADAMLATLQADGLTWAKPSYPVKYVMDNSEVYKGLGDMAWLAKEIFQDEAGESYYRQLQTTVATAIEQELWLEAKKMYSPSKTGSTVSNPDWNTFYADATAQLFPIWTGILAPDSERALHLYNTFSETYPDWPQLVKPDAFPWALIAYTAAIMGDQVRVDKFLQSVKASFIDQNHPWPWYVMESGVTMLAAAKMKEVVTAPADWSVDNLTNGAVITSIPYAVTGTAQGIASVEMTWTHQLTNETRAFQTAVQGPQWQIQLSDLLNGVYQVHVEAKDRFHNVLFSGQYEVTVQTGGENGLSYVVLLSEYDELRRGERTQLTVRGYKASGEEFNLAEAQVAYHTDHPELVSIDANGMLTLVGLQKDVNQIQVWGFVSANSDVVRTDTMTIAISDEPITLYDDIMSRLSEWIGNQQVAGGAITLDASHQRIVPSASNVSAMALLLLEENTPKVEQYIDWYLANWKWGDRYGVYGTQYEQVLDPVSNQYVSTQDYDSAGVNAATFVSLIKKFYEQTGKMKLSQYQLDIVTGGLGLMKLQDADGLMWKHPTERVKRLYDNAWTLRGMQDSVWLFDHHFQASGPSQYFTNYAQLLHGGIQNSLWDEENERYYAAIDENGVPHAPNLTVKTEAAEQLAAIYAGVAEADRSEALYELYNLHFPDWHLQANPSDAVAAYAAALMGDKERVDAYLKQVIGELSSNAWPEGWTVEDAGYVMLAAYEAQRLPHQASIEVETPVSSAGSAKSVKGTAVNAQYVEILWKELYGTGKGKLVVRVLPNGKWNGSLKGLQRGSEYELKVSAVDELGYVISETAFVRFTVR